MSDTNLYFTNELVHFGKTKMGRFIWGKKLNKVNTHLGVLRNVFSGNLTPHPFVMLIMLDHRPFKNSFAVLHNTTTHCAT